MFSGCNQLTSVIIGSGITELSDNFEKCYNLDLIKVAEGNPVYDSREDCNAVILTSENKLILGASKTTIPSTVTSIGSRAFAHSNITSVVIPASVKTIESSAFIHSGLASVKISEGVTFIGGGAFGNCPLSEVWCLNENSDIVELSFSPFYNNKCEILYVPKGTQDLYRANYAWNVFKTILDSDFSNLPTDIGGNAKTMDRSQDHTVIKQYNASGQLLFSSAKGLK